MAKHEKACLKSKNHTWNGGWVCTICKFDSEWRHQYVINQARKSGKPVVETAQPVAGTEVVRAYPKQKQLAKASGRTVARPARPFPDGKREQAWQADYIKRVKERNAKYATRSKPTEAPK